METQRIAFQQTNQFDKIFLDYIAQQPALQAFYDLFPTIENFEQQITLQKAKSFSAAQRQQLHTALQKQYSHLSNPPQLALDLLLNENTFTVTTGHQLNIFTGVLYFHYKIITVINAAKQLRQKYPQYHFVPVYWMASEDHDAAEISYFKLFGKKYTWNTTNFSGAVGRFSPHSLQNVIDEVPEMHHLFVKAYKESNTLAEATRLIVNELYGHEGLLVIDGDDAILKKQFVPHLQKELKEQTSFQAVQQTSAALEKLNYKTQVFAREINLFYLDHNLRERIVKEQEGENVIYKVLNTSLHFSEQEIMQLVAESPEKFSPNVILRPLYQEVILPNVSYTGGPGELAYWLQLKGVFEAFEVPFPILLPRNHALFIHKKDVDKLEKNGLSIEDIFLSPQELKNKLVKILLQTPLDLAEEKQIFQLNFQGIVQKLTSVDTSLQGYTQARIKEVEHIIEQLEKRLQKAQEQKHETSIKQVLAIQEKLCPNGGLQERSDNFLNFYLNDHKFLDKVKNILQPFDFHFFITIY
jgi:bacillithiol biosynthesis cysteine-adding enzyme BshC